MSNFAVCKSLYSSFRQRFAKAARMLVGLYKQQGHRFEEYRSKTMDKDTRLPEADSPEMFGVVVNIGDGLALEVQEGDWIKEISITRPLPEGRLLNLYHYTDRKGFEGLTSADTHWLPSLGVRHNLKQRYVRSDLGIPLPPESITSRRHTIAGEIAAVFGIAMVMPDALNPSNRMYGPGWYVTSLPPDCPTDELLQNLWGGNEAKRARTDYWLQISVSEFRVRTPDILRPDLKFVPIADARGIIGPMILKEFVGESLLSIDLLSAGSRSEDIRGRVSVTQLHQERRCLVPPVRFITRGLTSCGKDHPPRVLEFFGFSTDFRVATPESAEGRASDLVHTLMEQGRVEEALRHADESISCFPDVADLWSNRGVALAKLDRRLEAIDCYIRALDIRQDYPQARVNLAASLIKLFRFEEALSCVNDLLASHPDHVDGWFNRGVALAALAEFHAAIGSFDHIVALFPEHPLADRARIHAEQCRMRCGIA